MKHCFTIVFLIFNTLQIVLCQTSAILIDEVFDEVPIAKVFDVLETKYGLQIAYDYETVANIVIHKKIVNQSLDLALKQIFADTHLEYQLKNTRLFIRSEEITTQVPALQEFFLQGQVLDAHTGQGLEFATIFSKTNNKGCSTNAAGRFQLKIQTDKKAGELVVQYLGYLPRTIVWTSKKKLKNLKINLEPKSLGFEEITITEQLPTMTTAKDGKALVFHTEKLKTLPSFIGGRDIFRGIQLLPGIAADDDLSAELRIRGGTGDESMVIFDGITLYKTDHYFGIFSAVNSSIVNKANIYKNTFPVEYGGRTSGVVEFFTKEVERPKFGGGIEVDLLTSNAYLESPIGEKMTFLLGGRITNKNVAATHLFNLLDQKTSTPNKTENYIAASTTGNNNGNQPPVNNNVSRNQLLAYEPNFTFYDFNAKWTWDVRPSTRITAHYFQGYDEFHYDYTQEYTVGEPRKRKTNVTETYSEAANWLNKGWSVQVAEKWTDRFRSNLNISNSGYKDDKLSTSELFSFDTRRPLPTGEVNPLPGSERTTINTNSNYNEINGFDLNLKNEWELNDQQAFTFGYNYIRNKVVVDLIVDEISILDQAPTASQQSVYGQYNYRSLDDKWKIGLGLRSTYYSVTNKNYWSPRINLTYQASKPVKLKAAWSYYNQFLRRNYYEERFGRTYEFWVMADDTLFPVSTSTNWMTGFNFFHDFIEIDVEFYHKKTTGILEYALSDVGLIAPQDMDRDYVYDFFAGNRISKGIDVLLKKNIKNYSTWIAYTLSKTTHRFKTIRDGEPFPATDDQRHQIKWVNQFKYKKFDFSATYIYSSGRPYTDLSNFTEETPRDRENLNPSDLISYLESYQRIDIGVNYNFKLGKTNGIVGLSIFNLLNRKNVKYRQYILSVRDPENTRADNSRVENTVLGTELQMLDFTPNLSFSLRF